MKFQKAVLPPVDKSQKIYEDTMIVAKQIKKNIDFNSILKRIAFSRRVTPNTVRANVCSNLGLDASDWHNLEAHSVKAADKIACALIHRYPEKRNEILEVFKRN